MVFCIAVVRWSVYLVNILSFFSAIMLNGMASIFFLKSYLYFSWLQACPGPDCKKKVTEDNGGYRCEKCDRVYPDFKYRLLLSVRSLRVWCTCVCF